MRTYDIAQETTLYFEITYKGKESIKEYIYIYAILCLLTQLCWIPCNPMDYSPPGSSAHGILQAKCRTGLP